MARPLLLAALGATLVLALAWVTLPRPEPSMHEHAAAARLGAVLGAR
jgi:hypothetical protein